MKQPHPSGRPILMRIVKRYTYPRPQEDGYINPRLRRGITNAIDFTTELLKQSDQESDERERSI